MRRSAPRAHRNLAVLLVSHDLPQVLELADLIVVLRHGADVAHLDPKEGHPARRDRRHAGGGAPRMADIKTAPVSNSAPASTSRGRPDRAAARPRRRSG